MSEHDDDDLVKPPWVSDEMWEPIKAAYIKQKMASQAAAQDVGRMYREMDEDSLKTIAMVFNAAIGNPHVAAFHEGFARGILAERHDSWPGWNEPAFEFAVGQPDGGQVTIDATPMTDPGPDPLAAAMDAPDAPLSAPETPAEPEPPATSDADAMMAYGLIHAEQTEDFPYPFKCENCGTGYVSVQDRALRRPGPEGCSGCIQKAKWG